MSCRAFYTYGAVCSHSVLHSEPQFVSSQKPKHQWHFIKKQTLDNTNLTWINWKPYKGNLLKSSPYQLNIYIIAPLKVCGHPKNVMFAMKTHTLIYLMSSQMKSNTDKTLTRLEIMIFTWSHNFVLQSLTSSQNLQFAAVNSPLDLCHSRRQFVEVIWRNITSCFLKHLP